MIALAFNFKSCTRFFFSLFLVLTCFAAKFSDNSVNTQEVYQVEVCWKKSRVSLFKKFDSLKIEANNNFIAQAYDNNIRVFSTQGKLIWQRKFAANIVSLALSSDDLLAILTTKGELSLANINSKKINWKKNLTAGPLSSIMFTQHKLLINTFDNVLHAYSVKDGKELWAHIHLIKKLQSKWHLHTSNAMVANDSTIFIGFSDKSLVSISLLNGKEKWKKDFLKKFTIFDDGMHDVSTKPVVAGSQVFAASYNGSLKALDVFTGKEIWSNDLSLSYKNLELAEDTLAAFTTDGKMYGIDKATGIVLWQQAKFYDRMLMSLSVMDNKFIVADKSGYIYVVAPKTGRVVFKYNNSVFPIIRILILANNTVVTMNAHGELKATKIELNL